MNDICIYIIHLFMQYDQKIQELVWMLLNSFWRARIIRVTSSTSTWSTVPKWDAAHWSSSTSSENALRVSSQRTAEQAHLLNVRHNRQHPQEGSHCTVYALCKQVYSISHQALVKDAHETTNMVQSDPSGALLQVQDQLQEVLA